jgi:hypothetical protein
MFPLSMAYSYGVSDISEFHAAKAQIAVEQPRSVIDRQTRNLLLEKLPWDCRLVIWTHLLQAPYTAIKH